MNITIGIEENQTLALDEFTIEELELVAAFLMNTKLGRNISPHRDAAYTLLKKLEQYFGEKELDDHVSNVNMHVEFYDVNRTLLISANVNDVEFDVR